MDYGQIIKRAWEITRKYRFLWWLGLLALWTDGSFSSSSYYKIPDTDFFRNPATPSNPPSVPNVSPQTALLERIPRVLGSSSDRTQNIDLILNSTKDFFLNYWVLIIFLFLVSLALAIILIYISYSAKAGLVIAVDTLEKSDQPMTFKSAFRAGRPFAWRLFGLALLVGIIIFLLVSVLLLPPIIILIANQSVGAIAVAISFGLLALAVLIVASLYFSVLVKIADRTLILRNVRILQALEDSRIILRQELGHYFVIWLLTLAFAFAFGIIAAAFAFLSLLILFVIGYIIYIVLGSITTVIYSVISVLIIAAGIIALSAVYETFSSTYWTLAYRAVEYIDHKKVNNRHG